MRARVVADPATRPPDVAARQLWWRMAPASHETVENHQGVRARTGTWAKVTEVTILGLNEAGEERHTRLAGHLGAGHRPATVDTYP